MGWIFATLTPWYYSTLMLTRCCGSPPWSSTSPCGTLPLWAPVAATTTHASGSLTTLWRLKSPQETFISTKIHLLIQIQPHQICTFEQKAKGNSGHQHNNPPGTLSFGPGMAPNTSDQTLCLQKFSPCPCPMENCQKRKSQQ